MTETTKGRATRVSSQTPTEFSRKLPFISPLYCASYMFMFFHFTCPLKLPEIKRFLVILFIFAPTIIRMFPNNAFSLGNTTKKLPSRGKAREKKRLYGVFDYIAALGKRAIQ